GDLSARPVHHVVGPFRRETVGSMRFRSRRGGKVCGDAALGAGAQDWIRQQPIDHAQSRTLGDGNGDGKDQVVAVKNGLASSWSDGVRDQARYASLRTLKA